MLRAGEIDVLKGSWFGAGKGRMPRAVDALQHRLLGKVTRIKGVPGRHTVIEWAYSRLRVRVG